jgi:hypothetical protein
LKIQKKLNFKEIKKQLKHYRSAEKVQSLLQSKVNEVKILELKNPILKSEEIIKQYSKLEYSQKFFEIQNTETNPLVLEMKLFNLNSTRLEEEIYSLKQHQIELGQDQNFIDKISTSFGDLNKFYSL